MVAGLEDISGGTVSIGGRVVNELTPKERDVAMVFQNYALYPHLTVADNIAFGLRLRRESKAVIEERVTWAAKMLDLTPYLARRPKELSGGQRQRVAMGRAIVPPATGVSDDEPLEPRRKPASRCERTSRSSARPLENTTILRHTRPGRGDDDGRPRRDEPGRLQQVDTPQRLPDNPANLFVAGSTSARRR
jgi:multiple sugar transport system ATP-binding protein